MYLFRSIYYTWSVWTFVIRPRYFLSLLKLSKILLVYNVGMRVKELGKGFHYLDLAFVFRSLLLILLFSYLVLAGGKFSGLVLFPLYQVNTWLVAILGLAWIIWRLVRHRPFPSTRLDLPIVVWLTAMLLSTIFSKDPRRSLEWFIYYLVFVLTFYLAVDLLRSGWPSSLFLNCLLLSSLLILGLGLYEVTNWYLSWLAIGGLAQLIPPATIRVQATLGHANVLASYLNLLLPFGIAIFILVRRRFWKLLVAGWVLVVLGLIFLTSSRGGWLGTAAVLTAFTFLYFLDHRQGAYTFLRKLLKQRFLISVLIPVGLLAVSFIGLLLYRQVQNPTHVSGVGSRNYIWAIAFNEFKQNPLIGSGPGTYVSDFYSSYSVPPEVLLPHAHNFLINTLGEMGLLGLASVLFIAVRLVLSVINSWRKQANRTLLIAVTACLVGLAIHSQFEMPQIVPLVNLITALVIALITASEPVKVDLPHRLAWLKSGLLIFGYLLIVTLTGWWLSAYNYLERGMQAASSGNWIEAALQLDQAARMDDHLAHYWLQAGFAHSKLALAPNGSLLAKGELQVALADMQRGLEIDAGYSLNWANLAVLRYANGDQIGAIDAMQHSVNLAPASSVLQARLASLYEAAGLVDQAKAAYQKALAIEPDLARTAFFQATVLRQELAKNVPDSDAGWSALDKGNYTEAETIFRSRLGLNDSKSYLGLGLALTGMNHYPDAEKALLTAEFIDGSSPATKLALSKLYDRMGLNAKSTSYEAEAEMLQGSSLEFFSGWLENSDDLWLIFHRESITIN